MFIIILFLNNIIMEVVAEKFNNFKKFCDEIDNSNEWVIKMQSVTLEHFIVSIKAELNKNVTIDSIMTTVIAKSNISTDKLSAEILTKLKRYVEYFCKISQTI